MTQSQAICWQVYDNASELKAIASQTIIECADKAIAERGKFSIVLAGATTPREVYRQLKTAKTDWSKWHIYFGDERCLPPTHPDRNSLMARHTWLDHVAIPRPNIHEIPAELGPEQGALAYCRVLDGIGEFDLVLLGFGEDGHTASLFPDHPWEAQGAAAIPVFGAPKPPQERISLAASRLSAARRIIFLITGASKRPAVAQWKKGGRLPAAAISPTAGTAVEVFIDRAAQAE
jgi:6-phosphogluconolactonase